MINPRDTILSSLLACSGFFRNHGRGATLAFMSNRRYVSSVPRRQAPIGGKELRVSGSPNTKLAAEHAIRSAYRGAGIGERFGDRIAG